MRRRDFLAGTLSAGLLSCVRSPQVVTRRPAITHGVQAGDPQTGRALVWARCDEPARMIVEWDTVASFANPRRVAGLVVLPARDLCATVALDGLPDEQTVTYRLRFEREAARGASEWESGFIHTPRHDRVKLAWTGDTCGQGFGRNPDFGGMRGYAAIVAAQPDLFVHSGDMIYADNPIEATKRLDDGRVWKNVTNERVARVAQELDDFRARFAYNLEDEHVRALARACPIVAQWDDHEIHNNWWPHQQLDDERYTTTRDASVLAARARQAMFEYTPITKGPVNRVIHHGPLLDVIVLDCRAFRTPNDGGEGAAMLGAAQATWLIDAVKRSAARWKVIACDQPLGLVITDGPKDDRFEGWANTPGAPAGRELELARILAGIRGVPGVVWITADVHYAAAHEYARERATGADFDPFWEFVAGPIHAGTFGPNELDPTFGPEAAWVWAPTKDRPAFSPWDGLQTFGTIEMTRDEMVVGIHGAIDGAKKFEKRFT